MWPTLPLSRMKEYPFLILGIPTWDYGELQEDWEARWSELEELDLTGHTVALYGLGDQLGYPQWFQDAMGLLWAQVASRGARTVGRWPAAGYRFTASRALAPDGHHFVGLALDEENEFELTDRRLADWCAQLRVEFPLPQ
ncbi:MAG: flavodoxin [Porticoccaceae bacterium]|nr:MAG: flavodoxin [Porticoccaceae bacterium]